MARRRRQHIAGSRSADSRTLGSLGLELPAPGAPEPLSGYIAVGGDCACKGGGGHGPLGDSATTVVRVGSAAAAYLAYRQAGKSRGGTKYLLLAIAAAAGYEAAFG